MSGSSAARETGLRLRIIIERDDKNSSNLFPGHLTRERSELLEIE